MCTTMGDQVCVSVSKIQRLLLLLWRISVMLENNLQDYQSLASRLQRISPFCNKKLIFSNGMLLSTLSK